MVIQQRKYCKRHRSYCIFCCLKKSVLRNMNFQDVNSLNIHLNKLSGNLLPMTSDDKVFPMGWRIYSAVLMLIEVTHTSAMIPAIFVIPVSVALESLIIAFVVLTDVAFLFSRLHLRRGLVCHFIQKVNSMMYAEDATMRNIVTSMMKPVQAPLKFYCIAGSTCIVVWYVMETLSLFGKERYRYEDYTIPSVFSKEPFSLNIFVFGQIIGGLSTLFFFVRKIAVDVYMINILLLMTAQYRYTTTKLTNIFRSEYFEDRHNEFPKRSYSGGSMSMKPEMRMLCRRHIDVIRLTPILKELLSLSFSITYMTNIFRFCFVGIMLIIMLSKDPLEAILPFIYIIGGILQLYMVCSSVHQLLEASTQTIDEAFHEKWYQSEPQLKRMFLLMIMGNNLEMKLYTFGKYNLTLPSLMIILNQAYSIALLFLRMR